jgi:hypothetical protein
MPRSVDATRLQRLAPVDAIRLGKPLPVLLLLARMLQVMGKKENQSEKL